MDINVVSKCKCINVKNYVFIIFLSQMSKESEIKVHLLESCFMRH